MALQIQPYMDEHVAAVRAFNQRLEAGGADPELRFPESAAPEWLPQVEGRPVYQEQFVALENGSVRGGYILKQQEFWVRGETRRLACYRLPLSEGIVNKAYVTLGAQLLRDALKHQPLLFALGMGGCDRPLPRMLQAMGWSLSPVPFQFKVVHPRAFLRNIEVLRTSLWRRLLLNGAAWSGAGWLGLKALDWARTRRRHGVRVEEFRGFGNWADELWERSKGKYALTAVRDSRMLNLLYPADSARFVCIRVLRESEPLGWAVLLDTRMRGHKQFGNLRVGTIVDCLGLPEDAGAVMYPAARHLEQRGVDLMVSNQAHAAWSAALAAAGFLSGPSNFIFAASRQLSELLEPAAETRPCVHLNRGDGDGPIHLYKN